VFIVFPVFYLPSTSLLVPLFYFLFSDIDHIYLHIFQYLLLLLATSNFLSPTLLFSIFLHIQVLAYYSCNQIIYTFNFSFLAIYIFFFIDTSSPFICYLSPYNTLTLTFFIFSTILTTFLFFLLTIFIFSIISTLDFFIAKLQIHSSLIHFWFLLLFYIPTFQSSLFLKFFCLSHLCFWYMLQDKITISNRLVFFCSTIYYILLSHSLWKTIYYK